MAKIREKLYQPVVDKPPAPEVIEANKRLCEKKTRASMKDPEAVRIKGIVRTGASNSYLNGETYPAVTYHLNVNGKNSYGAYTGEK